MADEARVYATAAVSEFTAAVRQFQEEATNAVGELDQQLNRSMQWIEHDAPAEWRRRIRVQYDAVAEARSALENCKMRAVAGHEPACYEEKQALLAAKRKLELAEQKLEITRRWGPKLLHEVNEFRGRTGGLRRCLEADLPQALALLERMVASLDRYLDPGAGPPPASS